MTTKIKETENAINLVRPKLAYVIRRMCVHFSTGVHT